MPDRNATFPLTRYIFRKPARNNSASFAFSHGRTAFKYGLMSLNIPSRSEILVPNFICDVALGPILQSGLKVKYYPVLENLEPDWEKLKKLAVGKTAALLMVHYFGVPQKIEKFAAFAKKYRLALIEDNAHGHGGKYKGKLMGTFGDIGFSSPRKSFPVLNGGILYLKKGMSAVAPDTLEPLNLIREIIRRGKRTIKDFPLFRGKIGKSPDYSNPRQKREKPLPDWAMDQYSWEFIRRRESGPSAEKRRKLYKIWKDWTARAGVRPLYQEDIKESAPLCFAGYVSDRGERKNWFAWGIRHGFDVHSWPTLPEKQLKTKGGAFSLWEKLVCFPIHDGMDPDRLKKTLDNTEFKRYS